MDKRSGLRNDTNGASTLEVIGCWSRQVARLELLCVADADLDEERSLKTLSNELYQSVQRLGETLAVALQIPQLYARLRQFNTLAAQ